MKVSVAMTAALSTAELTERVIAIARDVPRALREDDLPTLARYRSELRAAIDDATGANLAILEVAHALFKYALPSARQEVIDLRTLLADDTGASLLERLARDEPVQVRIVESLLDGQRAALARLEEMGLITRASDHFVVPAAHKKLVRDEVEPAAFRFWRLVEGARAYAAVVDEGKQAQVIAGVLGVSEVQARAHLVNAPLTSGWNHTRARVRWQRKPHVGNLADLAPVDPPQRTDAPQEQRSFAGEVAAPRRSLLPSDRVENRPGLS